MSGGADAVRTRLLAEVVARDGPPCPSCRRSLEDVSDDGARCPHCRVGLRLTLDARGAGSGTWAFGVLAAAIGAGFYLLTAPGLVEGLVRGRGVRLTQPAVIAWAIGFLLTGSMLTAWFLCRARIRRWPRRVIVAAAIATLLLAMASIIPIAVLD